MTGKIHSIETFGTLDGPGIRYVIFLQGCPLRCKYCHNPDTWSISGGSEKSVSELVEDILKYKKYFGDKGGVTVSGGEPLSQIDFVIELFKALHELNIHTAIDTAGSLYQDNNKYKELLKYTDLVLLDIKHIDNEKCIDLTGKENVNELLFAKRLSDENISVWIRYVLLPDTPKEDLLKTRSFLKELKNVERIEVLPYHTMGISKYNALGIPYPLKGMRIPSEKEVETAIKILSER